MNLVTSDTPLIEAKDSLARLQRAWKGTAGTLPNGHTGNMSQEAVQRCVAFDTIGQLQRRIRRLTRGGN